MVRVTLQLLLLLLLATNAVASTAIARFDRTVIRDNESVQLTITLDESSFSGNPDLSVIEKDFEILGSNRSSHSSWINGQKSASTTWSYELLPRHSGMITIPAIPVGNTSTHPTAIQVEASSSGKMDAANPDPVFLEVTASKEAVLVQEELLLTIRINSAVTLSDLQMEPLKVANATVEQLQESGYERTIGNTPYHTQELVFAIYPQKSGTLEIPQVSVSAVAITGSPSRGFGLFNQGRTIRLRGEALSITVNPIPAAASGKNWLPAKQLVIHEGWSADPTEIHVGDSITRTITTTATGLPAETLPGVKIAPTEMFKIYPDQPAFANQKSGSGITGVRTDAIAFVATQPGTVTLPEVSVEWWDIASNSMKKATLPEITLTISGSPSSVQPPAPMATPTPVPEPLPQATATPHLPELPWQIATAVTSLTTLLFLVLYLVARRKTALPQENIPIAKERTPDESLQALQKACEEKNAARIREALLAWARLAWPEKPVHSTQDVARLLNDPTAHERIRALDAALYNGKSAAEEWNTLYQLAAQKQQQISGGGKGGLAPLYPAG
jgi:hypothetical protein